MKERAILIAGPTASGKSAFGLKLAAEAKGQGRNPLIINADSMQVYRELEVLTARPTIADLEVVEHALYGAVSAHEAYSVGKWLKAVEAILKNSSAEALPIFVGGTGLYFKTLLEGFAEVPEIDEDIRTKLRGAFEQGGSEALYVDLLSKDPDYALMVKPADGQRIVRALEVFESTGKSILWWHNQPMESPVLGETECRKIILSPDREVLYDRINHRFDLMVSNGAIEEVKKIRKLSLDPSLPAMKAIGVRQLSDYLDGKTSLDGAIEDASRETRRYAKRQMTWFRNQMDETWERS